MRRDWLKPFFQLADTFRKAPRRRSDARRRRMDLETLEPRVVLAAGDLDGAFNGSGKVTTPATPFGSDTGQAIALQADGKFVVAGNVYGSTADVNTSTDIAVIRYQSNGSIDTTFGVNGIRYINIGQFDRAKSITVDANGAVIVAGETNNSGGNSDVFLFRLTAAGAIDTTFNGTGVIRNDVSNGFDDGASSVIVEPDLQILIAGYTVVGTGVSGQFRLAMLVQRYNSDGSRDVNFGSNGSNITTIGNQADVATAITAIGDGRYLVTGNTVSNGVQYTFVTRLFDAGVIDAGFGFSGGGISIISAGGTGIDYARSIQWMPIGRIVVGGYARTDATTGNQDAFVMRLDQNGLLDLSFNSTGLALYDFGSPQDDVNAVVVQRDGRIVVGGTVRAAVNGAFAMVRWNVDGTVDTFFGTNGLRVYSFGADAQLLGMVLQPADQKLLAVGWAGAPGASRDFALARFSSVREFQTGDPTTIVRMNRAYNISADYHFFTTNVAEWQYAVSLGLRDETSSVPGFGVYSGAAPGSSPIYRLYNPNSGKHYYTLNLLERDNLQTIGWRYESIEGFMFDTQVANTTPIYRLYNKTTGTHLYTEDPAIRNYVLTTFQTWEEHTIFGYAYAWPLNFSIQPSSPASAIAAEPVVAAASTTTVESDLSSDSVSLGLILDTSLAAAGLVVAPVTDALSTVVSASQPAPNASTGNTSDDSETPADIDAAFQAGPWDWIG